MKLLKKILPLVLVVLFLAPFIIPLLHNGFFITDDGNWMVIRLSAFHQALKMGQFPVRWLPTLNHGYGYPIMNFLYPLPFYLGEAIHLIGYSFVDSVKCLLLLSFVLSAWGMYLFINNKYGRGAGIVAGVFYAIAPYRLFDVYKRGSLGEAVAFVFVPFVFYFLDKLGKEKKLRDLSLASLSFAALITSHNTLAFLFLPVIFIYNFYNCYKSYKLRKFLIYNSLFLILSFAASAFFWFPALYDLQFTRAGSVIVSDFSQFFISLTNFQSTVGLLIPLITLISLIILIHKKNYSVLFWIIITIVSLLLASFPSSLLWNSTPLPRLVQFPWRFLSLAVFSSAVLIGYLIKDLGKIKYLAVVVLIILTSLASFPSLTYTFYTDTYYSTNDDTTTVKNEYMPRWVNNDFTQKPNIDFKLINKNTLQINQLYFPGQTTIVNGVTVETFPGDNGLITAPAPQNLYGYYVYFTETPWRLIADFVSAISIVTCFLLVLI